MSRQSFFISAGVYLRRLSADVGKVMKVQTFKREAKCKLTQLKVFVYTAKIWIYILLMHISVSHNTVHRKDLETQEGGKAS